MALKTSSPYENTNSVESSSGAPLLQSQTSVRAVVPVSPHRGDSNEQKGPVYADVFTAQHLSEEIKAPPVVDRIEAYSEFIGFKNPQVR